MKCLEFLYFYLFDETTASLPASAPAPSRATPTPALTAPSTPRQPSTPNVNRKPFLDLRPRKSPAHHCGSAPRRRRPRAQPRALLMLRKDLDSVLLSPKRAVVVEEDGAPLGRGEGWVRVQVRLGEERVQGQGHGRGRGWWVMRMRRRKRMGRVARMRPRATLEAVVNVIRVKYMLVVHRS
jgi:hypothetical protein